MRADDCAMNNYLAWSRREIMNALIQRRILIPGIESMSRTHCRIALEEADDRRSFHLMQLPKEVRLMVYEAALSAEDDFVVRGSSKPALLSVSKQVQQEASEIFFRVNRFEFRIDHGYVSPSCLGHGRSCAAWSCSGWLTLGQRTLQTSVICRSPTTIVGQLQ